MKKYKRPTLLILGIGVVLFTLSIPFGCLPNRPYHSIAQTSIFLTNATSSIQTNEKYTLGFVEFDDQGWPWDRGQQSAILAELRAAQSSNGIVVIVFVHGWMHDASDEDENLLAFKRKMLRRFAAIEEYMSRKEMRSPRKIFGVYVGWRGRCQRIPYLNYTTFLGRKNAAERIGHSGLIELLCELEHVYTEANNRYKQQIQSHSRTPSRLLTVGHSFGADIVYSAVAPVLVERMVNSSESDAIQKTPSFGDMVVLINPAFEAARFETLHIRGAKADSFAQKKCILAVFTSKSDLATKYAFRGGRWCSTLLQSHRDSFQSSANRIAIGHFDPYVTYDLIKENRDERKDDAAGSAQNVAILTEQIKLRSQTPESYHIGHGLLLPRTNALANDPVFVAAVDPSIIPDHGSIDRWVFIRFLAEFLYAFSDS